MKPIKVISNVRVILAMSFLFALIFCLTTTNSHTGWADISKSAKTAEEQNKLKGFPKIRVVNNVLYVDMVDKITTDIIDPGYPCNEIIVAGTKHLSENIRQQIEGFRPRERRGHPFLGLFNRGGILGFDACRARAGLQPISGFCEDGIIAPEPPRIRTDTRTNVVRGGIAVPPQEGDATASQIEQKQSFFSRIFRLGRPRTTNIQAETRKKISRISPAATTLLEPCQDFGQNDPAACMGDAAMAGVPPSEEGANTGSRGGESGGSPIGPGSIKGGQQGNVSRSSYEGYEGITSEQYRRSHGGRDRASVEDSRTGDRVGTMITETVFEPETGASTTVYTFYDTDGNLKEMTFRHSDAPPSTYYFDDNWSACDSGEDCDETVDVSEDESEDEFESDFSKPIELEEIERPVCDFSDCNDNTVAAIPLPGYGTRDSQRNLPSTPYVYRGGRTVVETQRPHAEYHNIQMRRDPLGPLIHDANLEGSSSVGIMDSLPCGVLNYRTGQEWTDTFDDRRPGARDAIPQQRRGVAPVSRPTPSSGQDKQP